MVHCRDNGGASGTCGTDGTEAVTPAAAPSDQARGWPAWLLTWWTRLSHSGAPWLPKPPCCNIGVLALERFPLLPAAARSIGCTHGYVSEQGWGTGRHECAPEA